MILYVCMYVWYIHGNIKEASLTCLSFLSMYIFMIHSWKHSCCAVCVDILLHIYACSSPSMWTFLGMYMDSTQSYITKKHITYVQQEYLCIEYHARIISLRRLHESKRTHTHTHCIIHSGSLLQAKNQNHSSSYNYTSKSLTAK